jgi:hypothetical protein
MHKALRPLAGVIYASQEKLEPFQTAFEIKLQSLAQKAHMHFISSYINTNARLSHCTSQLNTAIINR